MLRRAIFLIHLYLGLTLGLIAALLGLSGSLLVFSHEIDERLNPQLLHASVKQQVAPVQPLLKKLKREYPKAKLQFIRVPQEPGGVYEIWMDKGQFLAYANPHTGNLTGGRAARKSLPGFLFDLHTKLLLGDAGNKLNGVTGIALFLLGITGLYLWWPRGGRSEFKTGRWRGAFTIRRGANPVRVAYDLHRVIGVFSVLLLCLVSATGAALIFDDAAIALISTITRDKAKSGKPKSKVVEGASTISLDQAVSTARSTFPDAQVTRITPALKKDAPIAIRLRFPTEMHQNGTSNVYIDRYSGKVLQADSALEAGPTARAVALRYPLHTGRWAGLFSRILQVLLGLVPAILYFSGLYVWWAKARKKRRSGRTV